MSRAINDMRLVVGMDSNGVAVPLRVDTAGRLEVVNERTVHAARVYHNASQSVSSGSWTSLAFNSEVNDDDGMHDTVTNNSRLTVVHAGVYLIGGAVDFQSNATGVRIAGIRLNFANYQALQRVPAVTTDLLALTVTTLMALAVGDYVELVVWQNSGGALNVSYNADYSPYFWAARL